MSRSTLCLVLASAAFLAPSTLVFSKPFNAYLLGALGLLAMLVVVGQALCLRRARHETDELRRQLQHAHNQMPHLLELAQRMDALADGCDIALQQQQLKLECTLAAFARIKARGQQLAGNAQQVGDESRQSLRLVRKGQAGLSASLMAFRSMDQSVRAAAAGDMAVQEVRALARESRDQAYGANLALAGLGDAANSISQCGTLIARDCAAQERLVEELDVALASIGQLAHTSAWRLRQARAASIELARGAAQLGTRLEALPRR